MLSLVCNTYNNILVTPINRIEEIPIKYLIKSEYYMNKLPSACDISITNTGVYFNLLLNNSATYYELVIYNVTDAPTVLCGCEDVIHICSKALYNYVCESLATGTKELVLPII